MDKDYHRRLIRLLETPLRIIPDPLFLSTAQEVFLADMPNLAAFNQKRLAVGEQASKVTTPELMFLFQEPLLEKAQEFHLFRKMNFLKWKAQQSLNACAEKPEEINSAEAWLREARVISRQIVCSNARLTVNVAKKQREYWQRNSLEILVMLASDACLGLVRAVDYFDYTKGFKFSTYATFAMYDTIRQARLDRNKHRYASPTAKTPEPEDYREDYRPSEGVTEYLKYLKPKERHVLVRSFGLEGCRIQKITEMAGDLQITKERVRQIRNLGLKKLRHHLQGVENGSY